MINEVYDFLLIHFNDKHLWIVKLQLEFTIIFVL